MLQYSCVMASETRSCSIAIYNFYHSLRLSEQSVSIIFLLNINISLSRLIGFSKSMERHM